MCGAKGDGGTCDEGLNIMKYTMVALDTICSVSYHYHCIYKIMCLY